MSYDNQGWGMSLYAVRTSNGEMGFAYTNGWDEAPETQWTVYQVQNGSVIVTNAEPAKNNREQLVQLALDSEDKAALMRVLNTAKAERPSNSVEWVKKVWRNLSDAEVTHSSDFNSGAGIINSLARK